MRCDFGFAEADWNENCSFSVFDSGQGMDNVLMLTLSVNQDIPKLSLRVNVPILRSLSNTDNPVILSFPRVEVLCN